MRTRESRRRLTASAVCAGLAVGFFLVGLGFALRHDFHRKMQSPTHNLLVAAALSDMVYDLNAGSIAHGEVLDALRANGMADKVNEDRYLIPLGFRYPENLSDTDMMNRALKAAASLESVTPNPKVGDGTARVANMDDLGLNDYFKMAFRLFGLRIEGFAYLYFVIVGIAVMAFLVAHWEDPLALAVLCAALAVQCITFGYISDGFAPSVGEGFAYGYNSMFPEALNTVHNPRFLSALGMIPMLHLVLCALRRGWSWRVALATVPPAVILAFAQSLRGTAKWYVLVVILATAWGLRDSVFVALASRFDWGRIWKSVRLRVLLPVFLFCVAAAGMGVHRAGAINPIYHIADELMPQHNVWHNLYIGLTWHPDWRSRFSPTIQQAEADFQPRLAAAEYLDETFGLPWTYLRSPLFDGLKERTYERVMKYAFWEFVRENPLYVFTSVVWYRPAFFMAVYGAGLVRALAAVGALAGVIGVAALCVVFWLVVRSTGFGKRDVVDLLILLGGGTMASLAPVMLSTPLYHAISDQFWMLTLAWLVMLALSTAAVISHFVQGNGPDRARSSRRRVRRKRVARRSVQPAMGE